MIKKRMMKVKNKIYQNYFKKIISKIYQKMYQNY